MRQLRGMDKLAFLDVDDTAVSEQGLDQLSAEGSLREVSLGPKLSSDCVKHLKRFQHLQVVDFSLPEGSGVVSGPIVGRLQELPSLREIKVTFYDAPGIEDPEDFCEGEFNGLGRLKELRALGIVASRIKPEVFAQIGELNQVRTIAIGTRDWPAGAIARLEGCAGLEELQIAGGFGDAVLLGRFQGLRRITVRNIRATDHYADALLREIGKLENLRELDLAGLSNTDSGSKYLSALKKLEKLNLCGTRVTDAVLEQLKELRSLTYLGLPRTVTADGVVRLQKALPDVQIIVGDELNVPWLTGVSDSAF